MQKKIEGIVISTVDYKESSKIINIFTKEEGIIGVIAKGSKNIKNKLRATTSKLSYGFFYINYRENSVSTLMEVDIIDNFKQIRTDLFKTNYSLYLLELTTQVYRQEKNKNIYESLINALKRISEGFDADIITNIIEGRQKQVEETLVVKVKIT